MRPSSRVLNLVTLRVIFSSFILIFLISNANAAGEVDPSFTASAFGTTNGTINVVKVQPDGKILVGGFFTDVDGFAESGIARLNSDGTVDRTFKSPDFFGTFGIGFQIFSIGLQSDGKIIVGGNFNGIQGSTNPGLRRLNPDGSVDPTFNVITLAASSTVYDIEILPGDKILMGGEFFSGVPLPTGGVARLNADGSRDMTFSPPTRSVRDIALQPDGKILLGCYDSPTSGSLVRLTTTGEIDPTFPIVLVSGGQVEAVVVRPNGQILMGGRFVTVSGFAQGRISLLNSDGSLDLTFNQNNPGANEQINDIAFQTDGKIIVVGGFSTFNSSTRQGIARLNGDGTLDTTFVPPTDSGGNDVEILPDGKVLTGKKRFNSDGSLDSSYMTTIRRGGRVRKIVVQPDGKTLIAGEFPIVNGTKRASLARLNADGSLDTSFVPFFNSTTSAVEVWALGLQPDGKVLIGSNLYPIKRLNADGSEDSTFSAGIGGGANDFAVLPNGEIIVGGNFSGPKYLLRLSSSGVVDSSFAVAQPNNQVHKVIRQPDGQILIGGAFSQIGTILRGRIARVNPSDGSLDNTFNPPGGANATVWDFDLQADGKVVIGGDFTSVNGSNNQVRVGRLLSNGALDTSFAQETNATVNAVKVQADGKILLGGSFSVVQSSSHNGIARLKTDGSVDGVFNTFANATVWDINVQSDGKILLGGDFTKINDVSSVRIARLLNAATPVRTPFDYDGDGRADVSVFRASTSRWYVLSSLNSTVAEQTFGSAGDVVAPADFDGDGKTDVAIYRPSNGQWWYQSSINGAQIANTFGASGDIPRPSDFDGDGKADLVLFRPSNSTWLRFGSTAGHVPDTAFGLSGDQPVIGDFDGDGKSDLAIFRPSNGDWWYAASSAGGAFRNVHWGQTGDLPAPADFDGDSKTDIAVFRPSDGGWYILNSSNGSFTTTAFGTNGDRPVAGDYDGDGRADIAIFRPSTSLWYLLRSTSGFAGLQFGISTDTPTPNAFVP